MDLMALKAVLSLDTSQYEDGLSRAGGLVGTLGGGLKTAMGVGAAAIGAATTAVIGLATASTSSYAEIEQLRGGVKKLFGDEDAKIVISNANKAFVTAGMSAQQYMDQVTSFSAALVNSLGGDTAEAANRADVAMRAISDNFNTFGGDIQNVQNAFQGFAKQNYTMLDNLKLGYGGTKTEMERLISDANEYAASIGQASDLSIDSFADVVAAIDLIQQKQHIAGTTAAEAAFTVSGSLGSVKAAWENLVAGFSDPEADLGQLMTNVVENAEVAFENLMPVFERALEGIGTFIEEMGPVLVEKLPELVDNILPSALEAAVSLTGSIAATLPSLAETLLGTLRDALITYGPTLLESGVSLVSNLASGVLQSAPNVVEAIKGAIDNAKQWIDNNLPEFLNRGVNAIVNMANGMWQAAPNVIANIGSIINSLLNALLAAVPSILQAGVQLILGLARGLINNLPLLLDAVIQITIALAQAIIENLPVFVDACVQILVAIVGLIVEYGGKFLQAMGDALKDLVANVSTGMSDMFNTFILWLSQLPAQMAYYAGYAIGEFIKFVIQLPSKVSSIFTSVMSAVASFGTNFVNKAREMASNFFINIVNGLASLPSRVAALGQQLVQAVADLPSKFSEIGSNIVQGLWNGIKGGWDWLKRQVKHLTDGLVQGVKDGLKIKSPSRVFMEIGKMVDEGFAKGIIDNEDRVMSAMQDLIFIPSMDDFGTQTGGAGISAVNAGSTKWTSGYTQIINITSPTALTPYEVARQTRNATRDMVLAMNI